MANKLNNTHNGFTIKLKLAQYVALSEIKEEDGISISEQIRIAVREYLQRRKHEF